ncbi:ABC transporter ATP-binding protein [Cryobacterium sp.]|jgi:peptide/nickel transport system ATP-binding protein|uniref:dipeptide ABC transporter ATP-binding protein n=1 Tax=Cryobacterium sp. TaxID=1926290 RepID=UPI002617796B|nr:ABC transporter ATP-binding protein [Cryobacterium sp.]MCU1446215.1 transporter ATP-binding protein [Cryobacterium sp.]
MSDVTAPAPGTPVLDIDGLAVQYRTAAGTIDAVRDVSLTIGRGERVAIVGESGSGKSTTAHAIVQLLAKQAGIVRGSIRFNGTDLVGAGRKDLRAVRGRRIGLVPQDPTVSLNPVKRIGTQVAEVLVIHGLADRKNAEIAAIEALRRAGLPEPELRAAQYPHELSGGMRQRVLIAIAIIGGPDLIIADEPTSALDVTVQRQILDHIDELAAETGMSVLLITHDLGIAADRADRIVVMSEGTVVEQGTPAEVLGAPTHPYTRALIAAAPSLNAAGDVDRALEPLADEIRARVFGGAPGDPFSVLDRPVAATGFDKHAADVLVLRNLVKDFPGPRGAGTGVNRAVADVSFSVPRGQTFALVGESGSGKTTTARLALRLDDTTSGQVLFDGRDITAARGRELRELRRRIQLVHQNPYASLNPRLTIAQIITDPLTAHGLGSGADRKGRAAELVDVVALPATVLGRRPAELSGGQRQRVAIARALAVNPELLVLDEPVSALDVSIQAQILGLLASLQRSLGLSYLFISHDLAVVRQIAHRVGVMRLGELVEVGAVTDVFRSPRHVYTRALLDAIPGRGSRVSPSVSHSHHTRSGVQP